jgi:hypothetical protein
LKAQGEVHNHKKIYDIMKEYGLLQIKRKRKAPQTTNSKHNLLIYENGVKPLEFVPIGLVWVSILPTYGLAQDGHILLL